MQSLLCLFRGIFWLLLLIILYRVEGIGILMVLIWMFWNGLIDIIGVVLVMLQFLQMVQLVIFFQCFVVVSCSVMLLERVSFSVEKFSLWKVLLLYRVMNRVFRLMKLVNFYWLRFLSIDGRLCGLVIRMLWLLVSIIVM